MHQIWRRLVLPVVALCCLVMYCPSAGASEWDAQDALFLLPWQEDAQGVPRPQLSRELAVLSAEFAKAAYVYTSGPQVFFDHGFTDVSYVGGRSVIATASLRSGVFSTWLFHERVERFVDTRFSTCKAFVSARRVSPEKAVVSIVFTGTKELPDWVANLVFQPTGGLHEGFVALAEDFDSMTEDIRFPELSEQLGEADVLTLADVLAECAKPDSRFLLWITGHSQGSAAAQCYIAHAVHHRAVLPAHVVAYTFASPTVADGDFPHDVAAYPIYNIVNTDDLFTKIGAQMRLGVDLVFTPDKDFRDKWYDDYDFLRGNLLVLSKVENMCDVLEYLTALRASASPALGRMLAASLQALKSQPFVACDIDALYKRYTGLDTPDAARVAYFSGLLAEANAQLPNPIDQFSAVTASLRQTHQLDRETTDRDTAYMAIAKETFQDLLPFIWQKGAPGERPSRVPLSLMPPTP